MSPRLCLGTPEVLYATKSAILQFVSPGVPGVWKKVVSSAGGRKGFGGEASFEWARDSQIA